jgi:uncharacterized protein YjbJ (UPF0337 family)
MGNPPDDPQENGCSGTRTCMEAFMNWEQIRGKWDQMKGEIKAQWGKLTDDDLTQIGGERDKLVGRLEELYGISKEEAERQVDELKGRDHE